MKKTIRNLVAVAALLCAAAPLRFGGTAQAASATYITKTANGLPAAPAETIFLSDPNLQIRLVNISYQSDTNAAALSITTGVAAYGITATNLSSSYATQYVNSVVGMVTNTTFILEHAGTAYTALLVATNNATNAIFGTGCFGVITSVGDVIYQSGTASTLTVGAATNAINGEAIFVGNVGRPVRVRLTPTGISNSLTAVTARYE